MSHATFLIGDVRERLAEIADGSVDLVVTSPPFLALRSYLPADHPDKGKEIGSEPTPAAFLTTLLELTAAWGRVLAPHGSLAVELGDTYAGSGGGGGDYSADGLRAGQATFDGSGHRVRETRREGYIRDGVTPPPRRDNTSGWPMEKSLCFIPELYGASLAYGRNLLTGEPSPAGQWRVRNLVAWVRPNPPVGALADKFRPATSYVTVATRARDRWFDLDAVRRPAQGQKDCATNGAKNAGDDRGDGKGREGAHFNKRIDSNPAGAPPLDWWEITPGGYSGAHYAVWPPELCKRLIESMCPRKVCVTCGEPSRRIVETDYDAHGDATTHNAERKASADYPRQQRSQNAQGMAHGRATKMTTTLGWSTCGHDTWRPGHVLDPFGGSGTTGAVATGCGRDATLIDLDERNADLARDRIGMFLNVEDRV